MAATMGLLVDPDNTRLAEPEAQVARNAAQKVGLQIRVLGARNTAEIERALSGLAQDGVRALLISPMHRSKSKETNLFRWRHDSSYQRCIRSGKAFPRAVLQAMEQISTQPIAKRECMSQRFLPARNPQCCLSRN